MASRLRSAMACFRRRRRLFSSDAKAVQNRRKGWFATWGNGDQGRLGLGEASSFWEPMLCDALQSHQPTSLACGGAHTLMLTEEGRVFTAGLNSHGQLGLPLSMECSLEPVEVSLPDACVHIAAGHYHSAAVTVNGETYIWGKNSEGQLGLGKDAELVYSKPQRLQSLAGLQLKMLALGSQHSLGLAESGEVLSWGANNNGCLGHGQVSGFASYFQDKTEYFPRLINALETKKIKKVSTGILHSACLAEDGTLFMFGQGRLNQLGLGDTNHAMHPSPLRTLSGIADVSCGGYHTGVTTHNGDLYTWGSNEYGCLGSGDVHHGVTTVPVRVEGLRHLYVAQVSCGWKHTAVITDNGELHTWGWGGSYGASTGGQLGLGDESDCLLPTKVDLEGYIAVQVSCGFNHTGAIIVER